MDDIMFRNRLTNPLTTGTPGINPKPNSNTTETVSTDSESFQKVLQGQLQQKQTLSFSKHVVDRISSRNIPMDETHMERLNEGMEIAASKGLDDTLIIVDDTAFVVSVKNKTIITAIGGNDLKGNVITNIGGTVII